MGIPVARTQGGWLLVGALMLSASTWVGCSEPSQQAASAESSPQQPVDAVDPAATKSTTPASGSPDSPQLEVLDEAGFAELLAGQRGNVVLVDFWATWCLSCIELFPHTAALQEKYGDQGLSVVTVALNDPDDEMAAVRATLERKGGVPANYICRYGASDKAFEIFAIENGTLPHLKLYDREGRLHKTFASGTGNIEPEQIDQAVEELLGP